MNLRKIIAPVVAIVMLWAAWRAYGWGGVAVVVTGLITWALLHFTRLMHVMKRAANRPKGYVGSAVMLNAKLKPKVNLLHVMALTDSLGERLSVEGEQPEVFRWTDGSESHVTCEFADGKLVKWTLFRPPEPADESAPPAP